MKIKSLVTKGAFKAGEIYDLPANQAMAMVVAGTAAPLVTNDATGKETAIKKRGQWDTR